MTLEQFILAMALRDPEAYSVSKIEDGNYYMDSHNMRMSSKCLLGYSNHRSLVCLSPEG